MPKVDPWRTRFDDPTPKPLDGAPAAAAKVLVDLIAGKKFDDADALALFAAGGMCLGRDTQTRTPIEQATGESLEFKMIIRKVRGRG
jgi:hypothetical protein